MRVADVVAGHLWFGLHKATRSPALYVTCLRRPLEAAISGVLYSHAKDVGRMSDGAAASFVARHLGSSHYAPVGEQQPTATLHLQARLSQCCEMAHRPFLETGNVVTLRGASQGPLASPNDFCARCHRTHVVCASVGVCLCVCVSVCLCLCLSLCMSVQTNYLKRLTGSEPDPRSAASMASAASAAVANLRAHFAVVRFSAISTVAPVRLSTADPVVIRRKLFRLSTTAPAVVAAA